jgi:hypothetical protein
MLDRVRSVGSRGCRFKRDAFDRVVPVGVARDTVDVVLEAGEAFVEGLECGEVFKERPVGCAELSPGIRIGIPGGYGTTITEAVRPAIAASDSRSVRPLTSRR